MAGSVVEGVMGGRELITKMTIMFPSSKAVLKRDWELKGQGERVEGGRGYFLSYYGLPTGRRTEARLGANGAR